MVSEILEEYTIIMAIRMGHQVTHYATPQMLPNCTTIHESFEGFTSIMTITWDAIMRLPILPTETIPVQKHLIWEQICFSDYKPHTCICTSAILLQLAF